MLVELSSPPSVRDSLLLGLLSSESFRNDQLSRLLSPPKFQFANVETYIAGIRDPSTKLYEIERLAKAWKYHVWLFAWAWYSELSREGFRLFVWYDDATQVPVGLAIWSLPYPLRPPRTLWNRLWFGLRRFRAWINHTWIQLWYPGLNPRSTSQVPRLFDGLEAELQFSHTEERERALLALSEEERRNTGYTEDLSYYLRFFGVTTQGKGHGTRLFDAINLNVQSIVVRNVRLEPKLTMIASPMGLPLYQKFGFHSIARAERNINNETWVRDLMICP